MIKIILLLASVSLATQYRVIKPTTQPDLPGYSLIAKDSVGLLVTYELENEDPQSFICTILIKNSHSYTGIDKNGSAYKFPAGPFDNFTVKRIE